VKEKASACSVRNDGGLWAMEKKSALWSGSARGCGSWPRQKSEEGFLSAQADTFAGSEREKKASACFVRNDGGVLVVRCGGHEVFQPTPIHRERVEDFAVRTNEGGLG